MVQMRLLIPIVCCWAALAAEVGPERGWLIVAGGGDLGPEIEKRFLDLAGGPDAPVVVIPTAGDRDTYEPGYAAASFPAKAGFRNITVLHTRDRRTADSADFAAPLARARAVWFPGGRQWRLVDSYLNTRTEKELWGVLERGGVIGGS